MKRTFILLSTLAICTLSFSQNTFPSSGNVGIGTTSPVAALSFTDVDQTTSPIGLTWYNGGGSSYATYYGIHRTAGSWTSPDYQQLRVGFETGIVLDPGTLYGKSYVDIRGNGLRITSGNVGIGTTNPVEALDIRGGVQVGTPITGWGNPIGSGRLSITNTSGNANIYMGQSASNYAFVGWVYNSTPANGYINISSAGGANPLILQAGGGNVGIGTQNINDANYKLFVETGIRTRKVKVDQSNWADYVFAPSYRLPSLQEVEAFIKQHRHLPDVPSEEEVKRNGINLGDNQALLLKKIEELTLYVIDQNKKQEVQREQISKMEDQIKMLQSTVFKTNK